MTQQPKLSIRTMTLISIMVATLCILAPLAIPISFVPVTLSTLILLLYLPLLGTKWTLLGCFLYLLLGIFGLPVFAKYNSGPSVLAGPSGGYLIGYFLLILIAGTIGQRFAYQPLPFLLGMILGTLALYGVGTFWLSRQLHLSFQEGLAIGVLPYVLGDTLKLIAALYLGPLLKKRLSRFLHTP